MKFFRRKCHYYRLFLQKKPLSSQLKNNKQILACQKNSWKHVMSSLIVYKLVSDKACDMWQEFTTKDILEILRVLNIMGQIQCNYCQASTLSMIRHFFLTIIQIRWNLLNKMILFRMLSNLVLQNQVLLKCFLDFIVR